MHTYRSPGLYQGPLWRVAIPICRHQITKQRGVPWTQVAAKDKNTSVAYSTANDDFEIFLLDTQRSIMQVCSEVILTCWGALSARNLRVKPRSLLRERSF